MMREKNRVPGNCGEGGHGRKTRVAVVGAGASGLAAAIEAARGGALVTVFEGGKKPGQKLLRTGAGRCNLSNAAPARGHYFGLHPEFAEKVQTVFPEADLEKWFHSIGILTVSYGGLKYPASEQARSVLDMLLMRCEHLGVVMRCGETVGKIKKEGRIFKVKTDAGTLSFDALILSCGSRAQVAEGAPDGYTLAKDFGMTIIPRRAVLVPLNAFPERKMVSEGGRGTFPQNAKSGRNETSAGNRNGAESFFSKNTHPGWEGVRAHADVALISDGKTLAHERGQVQFVRGGVSGIAVFNLSPLAVMEMEKNRKVILSLDLAPQAEEDVLRFFILKKIPAAENMDTLLGSVIPYKLIPAVLAAAGRFAAEDPSGEKNEEETARSIAGVLKHFCLHVSGTGTLDAAQAALGGVDTAEIDPRTMMSRRVPGLFVTGEMLDVTGMCGGFNLRFAWSTGILAGRNAASGFTPKRK